MKKRQRSTEELDAIKSSWFVDAEGCLRWLRDASAGVKAGNPVGVTNQKTGHKVVFLRFDGRLRGHTYAAVCWFLWHGKWPDKEIDHIDRDPKNNRLSNLRLATRKENMMNRIVPNKCGAQGVYKRASGRYSAQVWKDGKAVSLRTYDSIEEAFAVRREASKAIHGKFSVFA